jgi:hemoglobin
LLLDLDLVMDTSLYELIGEERLRMLLDRFYDLVFANPQIGHLFKTDKAVIKEKQRLFLTQFFGGPALYSHQYGHPKLRARHLPHPISEEDAAVWLSCMSEALATLDLEEAVKDEIFKRLLPTAMFMVNSHDY